MNGASAGGSRTLFPLSHWFPLCLSPSGPSHHVYPAWNRKAAQNCRFRFWWSSVISFLQPQTGGTTRTKVRLCVSFVLKGGERGERKSQGRSVCVTVHLKHCDVAPTLLPIHSTSPIHWFSDPAFLDKLLKLAMIQPQSVPKMITHMCF